MPEKDRGQSNLLGCAIQWDGKPHEVMYIFDKLPPLTRKAVNNSSFKLCVACVREAGSTVKAVLDLEERVRGALVCYDAEEDRKLKEQRRMST